MKGPKRLKKQQFVLLIKGAVIQIVKGLIRGVHLNVNRLVFL